MLRRDLPNPHLPRGMAFSWIGDGRSKPGFFKPCNTGSDKRRPAKSTVSEMSTSLVLAFSENLCATAYSIRWLGEDWIDFRENHVLLYFAMMLSRGEITLQIQHALDTSLRSCLPYIYWSTLHGLSTDPTVTYMKQIKERHNVFTLPSSKYCRM